jgi:hypothetical protein
VPRVFQDDLPSVFISRLRATGVITAEMTEVVVCLGDLEQTVGVTLRRFPGGGNWSRFVAPCCGWKVRMLRLLDGVLVCTRCCTRRGVRYKCEPAGRRQRAELRIPKLRAMLETPVSLRLKPVLWGKLERRSRLEAAPARCEYIVSQGRKFRDVVVDEIPPEPIARPKIKTTRKR